MKEINRARLMQAVRSRGFSSALGGGLDVKVNDRVAIQLDYFRPNFLGEAHNRGRLAVGVVLHLGKK